MVHGIMVNKPYMHPMGKSQEKMNLGPGLPIGMISLNFAGTT